MIKIFNAALGLLGALDAKSEGRMPQELAETVIGTMELSELYLLNRREFIDNSAVAAVLNSTVIFPSLAVPQNELWRVWHFDVQSASMGAGVAIRLVPILRVRTSADLCVGAGRGAAGAAITEQVFAIADRPFWAPPGSTLGFLAETLTGAVNCTGHALITKLRV